MERLRPKVSKRRCPYCHDDIREGLFRHCDGCRSLYHAECADELKTCGCGGTLGKRREHELLPLTGRSIGRTNTRRVLAIGLAVTIVPFLLVLAAAAWTTGAPVHAVGLVVAALVAGFLAVNAS